MKKDKKILSPFGVDLKEVEKCSYCKKPSIFTFTRNLEKFSICIGCIKKAIGNLLK